MMKPQTYAKPSFAVCILHMSGERGFGILGYIIAAGALVAALAGLYYAVDSRGYQRAKAEWATANAQASIEQLERERAVSVALAEADTKRQAAQDKASDYNAKWQEARRELNRKGTALAVCNAKPVARELGVVVAGGKEEPAVADGPAGDPGGSGISFTWDFVLLYDAAWTGQSGESLFPPAAGYSQATDAGAASPYGPGEVLDVHFQNAEACSADRRELWTLMDRIEKATKAWDKANAP